jgi:hypothetical protein
MAARYIIDWEMDPCPTVPAAVLLALLVHSPWRHVKYKRVRKRGRSDGLRGEEEIGEGPFM